MSRARKTFARKQCRQEDREDAAFINERLKELGPDPEKWETVSLDEVLDRAQRVVDNLPPWMSRVQEKAAREYNTN